MPVGLIMVTVFMIVFLMVLNLDQDTSSVWSLGTSVNSLGNKHHIIQSVEHPQMMIDAFEELWE